MKPNATLEDFQDREKFLINYIESQIRKLENQDIPDYPWMSEKSLGKKSAYKDILYKLKLGN